MSCNCSSNNLSILKGDKGDTGATGGFSGEVDVLDGGVATVTLTYADSGSFLPLNRAGGVAVALPSATADAIGTVYEFGVFTDVTNPNEYEITAVSGDLFYGSLIGIEDGSVPLVLEPNGTTNDIITMAGDATGGLVGTNFKIVCVAVNSWYVTGTLVGSPAPISTPFNG